MTSVRLREEEDDVVVPVGTDRWGRYVSEGGKREKRASGGLRAGEESGDDAGPLLGWLGLV